LNGDITDSTLVEKLLMLMLGTLFEPPPEEPDPEPEPDDPHAAAARLTTAARLTKATGRSERERRPPSLLLLNPIPQNPFHLADDT
jgi:hypothetical protein